MTATRYAHIISHTHWDREWYLNSPYTNEWLVPFFDALFDVLEGRPGYRFVLDGQTSMVEDCCEQLQRQGRDVAAFKAKLRHYVTERRLVMGPYYLQPDWQLVSDEALVRNLLIGHRDALAFGGAMPVGWLLDNFGQISQAPQIHAGFGLHGLFVWRGVEMDPRAIESEFAWESPDGTAVTAVYLLSSYRNAMRLAEYGEIMAGRVRSEVEKLLPFATTPNVLLMNGYDQEMVPDDILPHLADGGVDFDGVKVVQSTPEEYLTAITAARPRLKTLRGALYSGRYISVFPGILSSRMYLKTQNDACQRQLEKVAEPLMTVLWGLGRAYDQERLMASWRLLLKSHPHDSISGVSIDDVHSDMEARNRASAAISGDLAARALADLAANIHTARRGDAARYWVVVNTALRPRCGGIVLPDLPPDFVIQDAAGRAIPSQAAASGGLRLLVSDVPALGYTTLYAGPASSASSEKAEPAPAVIGDPASRTLENAFLKVTIATDGSLTVADKANGAIYENLAVFEDGSDAGDTYNFSPAPHDRIITSQGRPAQVSFLETGPVAAVAEIRMVLQAPEMLAPDRQRRGAAVRDLPIVTRLTLEAGSPLLRCHTEVFNTVRDHRLRVLFPTGIVSDVSCAETQFDVVTRPICPAHHDDSTIPPDVKRIIIGAREPKPITLFPQRAFVDVSDGQRGLAVLNRGLPEYEVLQERNTIALALFRGTGWIARPDLQTRIGDAGPMIAVPDAQCLRRMAFDYALLPHTGDWQSGRLPEWADRFNSDLLVAETGAHTGPLADTAGLLALADAGEQLKVTAVKRAEDGQAVIVRFFNPTTEPVAGCITSAWPMRAAAYANLNEERQAAIPLEDAHRAPVLAGPKKIVTVRLDIERLALALTTVDQPAGLPALDPAGDCSLEAYTAVPTVTEAEIRSEEQRAAELERLLAEKQSLVERQRATGDATDPQARLAESRLQLAVETDRRAALEARLSAILLRKKYLERYGDAESHRRYLVEVEPRIRDLGYKLNEARVAKRVYEYVVDFYQQSQ